MATILKGSIIWVGDSGSPVANERITFIRRVNWANFLAFADSLHPHTLCNRRIVVRHSLATYEVSPPGVGADLGKMANIYYRDPSNLQVYNFSYPAPIVADIESVSTGKRVKQSVVVTVVGYLNTMLGTSYIPLYGTYYERK